MLKVMRDSFHHLKWVLIIVVAAFIFGFVFIDMGMGGAFGGGGQDQGRNYAARVNGETIGFDDYNRALKNVEDMYRQQFGGQFTPEMAQQLNLPTQVMNMLVDQRLLTQEAARLNLTASPDEVRRKLMEIPNFTENGKFIGMELYNNYVGRLGYASPSDFEADLGREIALQKMESALQNSVVLSPKAIDAEYRRTNENAKVRYVLLPSAPLETVQVTQADIDAYYKAHQAEYTHGEQRKIRYILADYQKIRAEVQPSDAELRRAYETSKNEFKRPAAAKVLHILIKSDQTATPQADAAAKAKAESIVAQLRGGADFAALARQNSEDPSSSGNGGDMGWVDMGMTVEPFERAIFSIPLNQISDPIRTTEYGYHIVKVTERRNESVQTFEDARPALAARLANDMSRDIAKAEINRVNAQIKQKKPATSAEFIALGTGRLTSNDSGWFGRSEAIGGLGNNAPLSQWVFAAKPGDVSEPIGTPRGIAIAFVEMERGAGVAALADVRERVEQDAKRQKAREAAKAQLTALMAGAPTLEAIAAKGARPPQEVTVTHQGTIAGLTGDTNAFVDAALKGAVGQLQGPVAVGDGAVAFQVVEQKKVTDAELAQNRASFANRMREQQARQLRSVLVERLRKSAEVDINDTITRPTTTPTPTAGL